MSVASMSQTEARELRGDITLRTRSRYLEALGLADAGVVVPRTHVSPEDETGLSDRMAGTEPGSAAASSRSRRRSLLLHRLVAESVDWSDRESWLPRVGEGIARVRRSTRGEPHLVNLKRWEEWAEAGETAIMRKRMCATDEDACGLREVSPMAGFLTDAQRLAVLRWEREHYAA